MGHDQRFKEFFQVFLQDFLRLFYPQVEEQLDFQKIEFLDKEVFTDVTEGSRREADVVAKLRTRRGRPELVLVHIEIQSERKRNVPARMFEYCVLLWSRYKLPIFPVVVYLRGGKEGLESEQFRMTLFGYEVLRFRYESVRLSRLDPEEYRKRGDPVGAALGALMDRSKSSNVPELRASLLLEVAESGLDDAKQFLLTNLIETYFELDDAQIASYRQLISTREYRKVQEVELTWADKLLLQGLVKGKRESLLRVLETRFGPLPNYVKARVEAMDSPEDLDACLERALKATSLEETQLDI